MLRRRELMAMQTGGLPAAYRKIEYIQNPKAGVAYINTGIIVTEEVNFQVDFQLISPASTTGYFMGKYADTSFYLYLGAGFNFQTAFGCSWANSSLKGDNRRHVFTYQFIDGDMHLYDGETEILKKAFSASSSLPIYVAGPASPSASNKSAKTFSSKIWQNGTLIRNLAPCVRKSDSKPGMYDTVTKTFYTNAGTGEFIVPN